MYKISGFSGSKPTKTFNSFSSAQKATAPNIVQRAMISLTRKKPNRWAGNVVRAANTRTQQMRQVERNMR